MKPSRPVQLLTLAGLVAGLLTIATEGLLSHISAGTLTRTLLNEVYLGLTFGGSIAAYFVVCERVRSPWRIGAFIAITAIAYFAAMSAAFVALPFVSSGSAGGEEFQIPLPVFFVGGFVGSIVVLAAALLLFRHDSVSGQTLRRLPAWAAVGGLLGMIGWAAEPILGRPLWIAAHALGLRPSWETFDNMMRANERTHTFSMYLVWQTGVAACLGVLLATDPVVVVPEQEMDPRLSGTGRRSLSVAAALFCVATLGYFGLHVFQSVRIQRGVARRAEAYKRYQAEAPAALNLAAPQRMTAAETLLLEDMGGLFVKKPLVQEEAAGTGRPPMVRYFVSYVRNRNLEFGSYQGRVVASIEQYPNEAWARYRATYPAPFNPGMDEPRVLQSTVKFGSTVTLNTVAGSPETGGSSAYVWRNGTFAITITYEIRDQGEEILRRYLDRYPPS